MPRTGALQAGEKVQFTDRKGKRITEQLVAGGSTQTDHGLILHDQVIGGSEGIVVTTVTSKRADQVDKVNPQRDKAKPWKAARAIGGWDYAVMRPRMADYVLSMPRGAQIMYPKDIAQVIQLGDMRPGMRVLESGAGSGAMSLNLLDAVGESGHLTTIEMRPEFARITEANASLYYGRRPGWWDLLTGDFDSVAATLPTHSFDRIMLDMLDPWNRLEQAYRVIAPGGVLVAYVTTTTQMSRLCEGLRAAGCWTEPEVQETFERTWKAQGLAVRPDHQMIGHTGFLVVTRAMAEGFKALRKRERATKDTVTDVDSLSDEQRQERLADLELRDISDRKLRRVLRDLGDQLRRIDVDEDETSGNDD
ncbi:tRNA (adenine-N1)-methyltransferase [Bifidobacterium sp. ESL0763]|uniref:tRNA (adenine-N1)-methyltransferase n=1 Tax=Bifidobacterium sp. ESL0763 TaxID=2983227 RepID=UPI0023F69EB4|nr:tRNA (adenine-N1)-methyltransferase [Bifidobacterium sp. ESL0763]MDF7663871.1 tRNA (adenine-N1)-methyltransferase [Bifidobacterium sp. ESL0763]